MKAKKILSLLLAALMVLSALPLTFIGVFAEEAAAAAPTKLPVSGETYKTEVLFDNSVGVTTATTNWFSSYTGAVAAINTDAGKIVRNYAKGVMFTIDASEIEAAGALGITFCLSLNWGSNSTYISPTPWGAGINAASGTAKCPEDAVSNWYISKNGADWTNYVANEGSKRYASLSLEKDVYYVYVPMSEFWTRDGETKLKGGTPSAAEEVLNFADFSNTITSDYKIGNVKFSWGGALGDSGSNVKITDVMIVCGSDYTGVQDEPAIELVDKAPEKLPTTNNSYTYKQINNGYVITPTSAGYSATDFNRWQGTDMQISETKDAWVTGEGFMFKFDTSNVPESIDHMLGLAMQFTAGSSARYQSGDTAGSPTGSASGYYFVTAGMLRYHAGGEATYQGTRAKDRADVTTTWYYSIDGETWNTVVERANTNRCVLLTDAHAIGYVFIPFDQFWCMGPAGNGLDGYRTVGTFADGIAAMTAAGSNFNIGNFGLNLQSSSNSANKQNLAIQPETVYSKISFVYDGILEGGNDDDEDTPPEVVGPYNGTATQAPARLPDTGKQYISEDLFYDSFNVYPGLTGWQEASNVGAGASAALVDGAQGVMFRIDSTNSTKGEDLGITFNLQIKWSGGSTYISPTPYGAAILSNGATVAADGASSTWYISADGETWTAHEVNYGSKRYAQLSLGKGVVYVYIPMSEFWTKDGATKLAGNAQEAASEPSVNFATFESIVGKNYYISMSQFAWGGKLGSDANVKIDNFDVVTTGVPKPVLPPIPEEYETLSVNDRYQIKFNASTDVDEKGNYKFSYWQGNDMGIAKLGSSWLTANGFMFKFDTSGVDASNKEMMGLSIQFSIGSMAQYSERNDPGQPTGANSGLYFVTAGMVRYHGGDKATYNGEKTNTVGVTSTWYYTTDDGATWKKVVEDSSKSRCATITNEHAVGYIYVPFDSLWCMGPAANGLFGYKQIGTFADGIAALRKSGNLNVNNFGLCLNSANAGASQNLAIQPQTVFSEFCFVKFDALAIDAGSLALSNSISWNVYATVPYQYTNPTVTFTLGDSTVVVEGVRMPDGKVKFTLTGITPEQVAETIGITLSVTDKNGNQITKTAEASIADYCADLMAAYEEFPEWQEAIKAFLHYVAEIQKTNEYEGTLANEGIEAVTEPVDVSALTGTLTNNAGEGVWSLLASGVTPDGMHVLIVGVANGATAVRCSVNGVVRIVKVTEGVAMIPVSFMHFGLDVTVECYDEANEAVTEDGSLVVSVNYVLGAAYAQGDAATQAYLQAIANLAKETAALQ